MPSPDNQFHKFVKVKTDEGKIVSGFLAEDTYDDCHRPSYTGHIYADFSEGFPKQVVVLDFDIRNKKDEYHISNNSQISILSLDEAIRQIQGAKQKLRKRLNLLNRNSLAACLIDEYIDEICSLESALFKNDYETFSDNLDSLGKRESRRFVGYRSESDPNTKLGWNHAQLFPEKIELVGGYTSHFLDRLTFSEKYDEQFGNPQELGPDFWPVSNIPLDNKNVQYVIN